MKINLGYVALPMTLDVTSSHTMTYTRYQMLGPKLGNAQLHKIILSNFDALEKILYYNYKNKSKKIGMMSKEHIHKANHSFLVS